MDRILINWDNNNPKLRCYADYFIGDKFFIKDAYYQIYRVVIMSGVYTVFLLYNDQPVMFLVDKEEPMGTSDINKYFSGFDKFLKKAIRKLKLEDLEFNAKFESSNKYIGI